ncbi:MAG: hypothetical protein U0L03_06350, partial [Succinivibrionaceae bacterium]|nr:hypothetical protein [Succinivibrionaceae bacterium]
VCGYLNLTKFSLPLQFFQPRNQSNFYQTHMLLHRPLKIPKSERMATGALVKAHRVKTGLLYRFKLLLIKWF